MMKAGKENNIKAKDVREIKVDVSLAPARQEALAEPSQGDPQAAASVIQAVLSVLSGVNPRGWCRRRGRDGRGG